MLRGREAEQAAIDDLLERIPAAGGAIVLRGEPGIGKSALLAYAADRARDLRVLRAVGVEAESELAFASLHQLLRPVLDGLDALPEPQARALRTAFGLEAGASPDRFLVSVAALTLLSEAAGDQPLLCLVDDAQWADAPSLEALAFVARRVDAEPIGLVLAVREDADFAVAGVRELRLAGLDANAAAALLDERGEALAPAVRERVLAASGGNPLALIELPAGADPMEEPLPLAGELERAFLARVRRRGADVQSLILLATAEGSGRLATVRGAAERLGLDPALLDSRDLADVLRIEASTVSFRHPLVRSAVYHGAAPGDRRAAHAALAAHETEPDRRAWHRALATDGPDEDVACELELAAERALQRSGHAAAAAVFERAAALSLADESRARRLTAAASTAWRAGEPDRTRALLYQAERLGPRDAAVLLEIQYLRGFMELRAGAPADAVAVLLPALRAAVEVDPRRAVEIVMAAREAAFHAAKPAAIAEIGEIIGRLEIPDDREYALVTRVLRSFGSERLAPGPAADADLSTLDQLEDPALLVAAGGMAWALGAHEQGRRLRAKAVARARALGAAGTLAWALEPLVAEEVLGGRYAVAEAYADEGRRLASETAQANVACLHVAHLAELAALRGRADDARRLAGEALADATARHLVRGAGIAHHALAVLALSLGDADEAYQQLEATWGGGPTPGSRWMGAVFASDQIEAAQRADRTERTQELLAAYLGWVDSVGSPELRALAARCRALVATGEEAQAQFEEALRLHAGTDRPLDHARTELLYGEFLRRERRRVDARAHLRTALETFERLATPLWAERARQELRATGETARKRDPSTLDQLTPQEVQVVRAVATGATNREVAAQLFISPRTVDHHLRRVFRKLDISSRKQLIALGLSGDT